MLEMVYKCDYCGKVIGKEAHNLMVVELTPDHWLDPLFEASALHFHRAGCHYEFTKIVERTVNTAKTYIQNVLADKRQMPNSHSGSATVS